MTIYSYLLLFYSTFFSLLNFFSNFLFFLGVHVYVLLLLAKHRLVTFEGYQLDVELSNFVESVDMCMWSPQKSSGPLMFNLARTHILSHALSVSLIFVFFF